MKFLILTLLISLISLNAYSNDDRLSYQDRVFIKYSDNFEIVCNVNNLKLWIDTNFADAHPYRLAFEVPELIKENVQKDLGEKVVGIESLVIGSKSERGFKLDTTLIIGDIFYGENEPKMTSTFRVYEKDAQTIIGEYMLYDYDENNEAFVTNSFPAVCEYK